MEMQGNIYDEIRILLMLYSYKPLDLIEDINILNRFTCAPVTPILAQKLFTASGGNPLRLKAVKVNSRGSSQSRQIPTMSISCYFQPMSSYIRFVTVIQYLN